MKQKLLSLVTAITIMMLLMAAMPIAANSADTTIKLGDYVQIGTYEIDGITEPILWRCVAFEKANRADATGNPIIDSTDTVTEYKDGYLPLMFADDALCKKVFDSEGSIITGSHGRDTYRTYCGSNYWGDSNIRDWLNSSAEAGGVTWSCGNAPPYKDEKGFLADFNDKEKAAIKIVTQKSLLHQKDYDAVTNKSGDDLHIYVESVANVDTNYSNAYSEQITDAIFLLDVRQLYNVYLNDASLGGNSYYKSSSNYWLRSPFSGNINTVRTVYSDGKVIYQYSNYKNGNGVRPAFFLSPSASIVCGSGTSGKPYRLAHIENNGEIKKQPTCTETGTIEYRCTECQEVSRIESLNAVGHSWGEWEETNPATEYTTGTRTRICTSCHKKETQVIPPIGTSDENAECVKITAQYSENGALIRVTFEKVKVSDIVSEQNTKMCKVFYWENLESMKPLSISD